MLLPSNSSLKDQRFAEFLDESAKEDYSCLSTDPLTCEKSVLEHLAVYLNVDIAGLSEKEAREYLKNTLKSRTKKGTVGAVEDALNSVFDDVKLLEWFDNSELKRGEFGVEVSIKADTTEVYDKQKFKLTRNLIDRAKNVRSHLNGFTIKMPQSKYKAELYGVCAMSINLDNDIAPFKAITKPIIGGAIVWNF